MKLLAIVALAVIILGTFAASAEAQAGRWGGWGWWVTLWPSGQPYAGPFVSTATCRTVLEFLNELLDLSFRDGCEYIYVITSRNP